MASSTEVQSYSIGHWFNVAVITNVVAADAVSGIGVSNAYIDRLSAVVSGNFFMNVLDPVTKKVERIYVPAAGVSADGLTIGIASTGEVTRGLKPTGIDKTDGSSTFAMKLAPGMIVGISMDPQILNEWQQWFLGNIGSGGIQMILGNSTDNHFTMLHRTASGDVNFIRRDVTTAEGQFWNGSAWVDFSNAGVGTITWGNGLNGGSGNANPFVEIANSAAFMTGDTGAESTPATWAAITNGSFRISIDGTAYNIDAIDFTGDASMADVASTIQAALRAVTGGSETVAWSTDHFIITSVDFTTTSAVTVTSTSTGTVGTDISGAGGTDWMDADTGNGTVTAFVENGGLEISASKLRVKIKSGGGLQLDGDGLSAVVSDKSLVAGENLTAEDLAYVESDGKAYKTVRSANAFAQLASTTAAAGYVMTLRLSENKVVTVYSITGGLGAAVSTLVGETDTTGSSTTIDTGTRAMRAAVIGTDKFVVTYELTADNDLYAVVCTVSGTTITVGTPVNMYSAENVKQASMDVSKLDTDKFLISFVNDTSLDALAIAATVSGTVITKGSSQVVEAITSATAYGTLCAQLTTDAAIIFYNDGTNITTKLLTISGTTITVASAATDLYADTFDNEQSEAGVIVLDTQNVLFYNYISTTEGVRVSRLHITADTAFAVAPGYNSISDTFLVSGNTNGKSQMVDMGNNLIGHFYSDVNGDARLRIYELSDNAFKEIYNSGVISALTISGIDLVAFSSTRNRLWLACGDGGDTQVKYSVFLDTSDQFIGVVKATVAAAATATMENAGDVAQTGLTVGQQYYVGDAGAAATTGQRRLGVATATDNLYLN